MLLLPANFAAPKGREAKVVTLWTATATAWKKIFWEWERRKRIGGLQKKNTVPLFVIVHR